MLIIIAFGVLFFTDNLKCIGLPFHKDKAETEQVEAETDAPSEEVLAEPESE